MRTSVYLIDDDADFRASLKQSLEIAGIRVSDFNRAEQALVEIDEDFNGIVISDIRMAGMDGLAFMMEISEVDEDIPVILISGHADVSTAVQAIQDGAYDLLEKPFRTQHLLDVVRRAREKRKLVLENRRLRKQLSGHKNSLILGDSQVIRKLRSAISRLSPSQANILISGELGTGKELVARSVHNRSDRSKRSFMSLNCGSMSEQELDRELFGSRGASPSTDGLIHKCHRGTLYLEEIDQLSSRLSVKLLTLTREVTAARSAQPQSVYPDIRFIASSHRPLEPLCREGSFREDLYYALGVLELRVPPLRERREDIPLLFKHFAAATSSSYGVPEPVWSESQITELARRDWRGNLRALHHMAERWVLTGQVQDSIAQNCTDAPTRSAPSLPEKMEQFEKLMIEQALQKNRGNVTQTHRDLCIPRKTLYDKLQRHALKPGDYRDSDR